MNLNPKLSAMILIAVFATGCAHSDERPPQTGDTVQCEKAKYGVLDIDTLPNYTPSINAYLLTCAVSVVISEVSLQSGPQKGNKKEKVNKRIIADYFLSKPLDLGYRTIEGDNVLMSIITSFLPDTWKETAIRKLISDGINLREQNNNGDTALDIARFKGNQRIIDLVSK